MIKFIVILCLIVFPIGADDCPQLGIKGYYKSFPNPLVNNQGQKVGYHVVVKIAGMTESVGSFMVNDTFDGSTGMLQIHSDSRSSLVYYHYATSEGYIIKNGSCELLNLTSNDNLNKIVSLWSSLDLSDIQSINQSLGPTGLLINYIKQQKDLRLVMKNDQGFDIKSITKISTNWATCLPTKNNRTVTVNVFIGPSRKLESIILKLDNTATISLTFTEFHQLPGDQPKPVIYPYGYGCNRMSNQVFGIPKFTESRSFKLEMEIALHFGGAVYAETLYPLSILRYQGIYSYDAQYDGKNFRVIYDPDLEIEYVIDLDSGICSTKKAIPFHSGYLKWPYTNDSSFNILSPMVLHLRDDDIQYFGEKESGSQLLDIYERKVTSFALKNGEYRSAIIDYFIPTKSITQGRSPSNIEIRLSNIQKISNSRLISRIDLKIIEYIESDDIYDPYRFDLRSCQNELGHSIWFQIVYNSIPVWVLKNNNRQAIVEPEFRKVLESFIPMMRLSNIQIGTRGSSLYITSKLSDGPSILFAYEASSNYILKSGMESIKDNDEDCARLCTGTSDCKAFSYCDDRKCTLHTDPSPVRSSLSTKQCTVYKFKLNPKSRESKDSMKTQVNQFTSSSILMNQIKTMVDNREFTLPSLGIADVMFVVSGPYEVGGYSDTYKYDHSLMSKLNDYKLLMSGYELVETVWSERVTGLKYLDCLYKCENDDDCLTVSYCNDGNGACTTSSNSGERVKLQSELKTLKTSCSIMSKIFIDFFNRLPGRSLIWKTETAPRKLSNLDRDTCAKACLDEQSFTCEAFDLCESHEEKSFDCYLRVFHIFGNDSNESYSWDSSNTRCNHYTRKLSMDYKQFAGMKLKVGSVIGTIEDNSLENCAAACNRAEEGCVSFEYCQLTNSMSITSSCRLSSHKVLSDTQNMTSNSSCSVYGIVRAERNRMYMMKGRVSIPLAVLAGMVAFIFGVLLSAVITANSMGEKKY